MNNCKTFNIAHLRAITFAAAVILHVLILLLVAFTIKTAAAVLEPLAGVMKLVDVEERSPPERPPDIPQTSTQETIAETMIETDVPPPPVTMPVPFSVPEVIEYLPQHRISVLPVLPEADIRRAMIYPPIAQRSNIEGMVILELFIDRLGNIRNIEILREEPANRGFADAALAALKGIIVKPAEANGAPVAVRFRYPIRFALR